MLYYREITGNWYLRHIDLVIRSANFILTRKVERISRATWQQRFTNPTLPKCHDRDSRVWATLHDDFAVQCMLCGREQVQMCCLQSTEVGRCAQTGQLHIDLSQLLIALFQISCCPMYRRPPQSHNEACRCYRGAQDTGGPTCAAAYPINGRAR